MYKLVVIWVALIGIAALSLYEESESADLRIGMLKTVDTVHPLIAQDNGYFEDEGLRVAVYPFGTSPLLAEAIAAGEIDAAYMSVVPTGIWKGRGTDIIILAGASRGGDILCARDGLQSGKIAMSGRGTMTQTLYETFVQDRFDFEQVIGIEPADMPTALMVTKDVEAAFVWEPFASQIEKAGGTCIFDTGAKWQEEKGVKYQRNVLVVSGRVARDPELVRKLISINSRTIEFLNSPGSDARIARVMNIEPLERRRMEYNSSLDWDSMVELWETARANGYMTGIPKRSDIIYGG